MARGVEVKKIILFLSVALLFAGCQKKQPVGSGLQIQLSGEPVTLDPSKAEDGLSLKVLANVMEGLFYYDGEGKLQNGLARSYEVSPDQKKYTFTIREYTQWSDGIPLRPKDFVFGLRRALNKNTGAKLAFNLFAIQNAEEVHAGKLPPEKLGVREENSKLVIELKKPCSYFIQVLTLPIAMPLREDLIRNYDTEWTPAHPVTGRYKIAFQKPGEIILLEPNTYYWGAQNLKKLPYPPIVLRIVADESTGVSLFESGKLDILTRIPAFDTERLRKKGVLHIDPMLATYFLAFNTRKPPFQSVQWRQAVSGAIRRDQIVTALGSGEKAATSWIPEPLEGFEPVQDFGKKFSNEITHLKASNPHPQGVILSFDGNARNSMILEKIQSDLAQSLNLKVELTQMDWKSYVKQMTADPSAIFRFGWMAPYYDPITHLEAFISNSPNNSTGWKNNQYDELVKKISEISSGPKRLELIKKAQKILVENEAIVVPIYHYVQTHAVSKRVTGFKVNPFGVIRFDELVLNFDQ